MDLSKLKAEITNDPLPRGYAGMTDAQVADRMRVVDRPQERNVVQGYEVIDCIEPAALAALTAIQLQRLSAIVSAFGGVNIKSLNTRANVAAIFPANPTNNATRAALNNLKDGPLISRDAELGLPPVHTSHVTQARALP